MRHRRTWYGQGWGWSKDDWKKFNKAQKKAAKRLRKAVKRLRRAAKDLSNGGKISRRTRRTLAQFAGAVGGSPSAADLKATANMLAASATALADDGTLGYVANSYGAEQWAIGMARSATAPAAANTATRTMLVNTSHPLFGPQPIRTDQTNEQVLTWMVGHESLHNKPNSLEDQYFMGSRVYQYVDPARVWQLGATNPQLAIQNPDNILQFVFPW